MESYEKVEKVWKRALGRAGRMDLDSACSFILPMVEAANAFDANVDIVVRHMTDLRCSNEVGVVDHDAVEEALIDGPSRESSTLRLSFADATLHRCVELRFRTVLTSHHRSVTLVDTAIADIEDDLMLQLTASGFQVKQVDDEAAAAAQAEIEEKARRATARKAVVRSHPRLPTPCQRVSPIVWYFFEL